MIRDLLDATKNNLEGKLSPEERECAELIMYRMLETARQYKTLIPVVIKYVMWFKEYQRGKNASKKD
jgi:hypothetical protein